MRRAEAFPGRFLTQHDAVTPIVATIASVWQEELDDDGRKKLKNVMGFIEANLKPMIVNPTNWDVLENAYGDSDDWHGKRVEIYVNPDVMMGTRKVGGLRVRIPAPAPRPVGPAPATRNGNGATGKPAPKPAPAPAQQPSLADRFTQASNGIRSCTTVESLNRWLAWAQKISFTQEQQQALQDLYSECTRELTAPVEDDIPF